MALPPAPGAPLAVARDLIFAPLEAEGLGQRAARRIAEAIGLGLLDVGDRLPAESELAERFGIAPMTLREALALLREAGYIETRRGRGGGTVVRAVQPQLPAPDTRSQRLEKLSLGDLRDITDYREALEGGAAALAARRASIEHITELQTLVDAMADAADYATFRRLDRRFHISIAASTGSRRLTRAMGRIQAELREIFAATQHPDEGLGFTNGQHRAILGAVVQGESQAAQHAMITHVQSTGEYMIRLRLEFDEAHAARRAQGRLDPPPS